MHFRRIGGHLQGSATHAGVDTGQLGDDRIMLGLLALSVISFFAILIGSASHADFSVGLWPAVGIIVYVAPILAFAMLLTVLIMTFVRRARANRSQ